MAREVLIRQWCDVHLAEHEEHVEATPVSVTISKTGPLVIDLCEEHINELVKPMLDLIVAHGSRPEARELAARGAPKRKASPARKPAPLNTSDPVATLDVLLNSGRRGRPSAAAEVLQCLWCPMTYSSGSGFTHHVEGLHGFTNGPQGSVLQDAYGGVCPLCFKEVLAMTNHAQRSHAPLSHLTDLFTVAAAQGDPHGVVASRLKAAPITANTRNSMDDLIAIGVKLAVSQPTKKARKAG